MSDGLYARGRCCERTGLEGAARNAAGVRAVSYREAVRAGALRTYCASAAAANARSLSVMRQGSCSINEPNALGGRTQGSSGDRRHAGLIGSMNQPGMRTVPRT